MHWLMNQNYKKKFRHKQNYKVIPGSVLMEFPPKQLMKNESGNFFSNLTRWYEECFVNYKIAI